MFLLFVDKDSPSREDQLALAVRDLFQGVFEEIGETALADSTAHLEDLIKSVSAFDDCLVIPFGEKSAARTPFEYHRLPVLFSPAPEGLVDARNTLVAFQLDGADNLRFGVHNRRSKVVALNWPLWNAPTISRLRGRDNQAEKEISFHHHRVLSDTLRGSKHALFQGVVFAASLPADAPAERVESLIGAFTAAFRHNADAALRIHIIEKPAHGANSSQLTTAIRRIVDDAGPIACRIIAVDAAHAGQDFVRIIDRASFYVVTDDLADHFAAAGYFSAQIPVILSQNLASFFGLPEAYALAIHDEAPLETVFRNAFHIAKTAPDGYRQLRRNAMDGARDHFSRANAAGRMRQALSKPDIVQHAPRIDIQRVDVDDIGIYDYVKGGWFDSATRMLAPGFRIDEDDIVVDVGCGAGGFSRFSSAFAKEVVYCDVDAESLEKAGKNIGEAAKCPIRGIQTAGEALDIEDQYADKIICTEVLEHVDDPEKVMSELFRVGKPGSLYLVTVPDTLNELLQKPLAPPEYFQKPNHIRIFERDEFESLVVNSGLEIVNREFYGFFHAFRWLIIWFEDPALDLKWAQLWKHLLEHEKGPATKAALDHYIAKSQSIIARKPQ